MSHLSDFFQARVVFEKPVRIAFLTLLFFVLVGILRPAVADDWPTYRNDSCRSGVTKERLSFPLEPAWQYQADHGPRPSWPDMPATEDFWNKVPDLKMSVTYDRAFPVVVADGRAYFGSSADDTVRCLDVNTGTELWRFTTEGPVRLAPTIADGRVYVGSDDGRLYALDAKQGTLLWTFDPHPQKAWLPGNGRYVARQPVRCGIVVEGKTVYFAAGLFPMRGVDLFAVDAETGKETWRAPIQVSSQGYMAATNHQLIVPTGRTAPALFERANGKPFCRLSSKGGSFALVTEGCLAFGQTERGQIRLADTENREVIVAISSAIRMIADGPILYVAGTDSLYAMDRKAYLAAAREATRLCKIKKRTPEQNGQLADAQRRERAKLWKVSIKYPNEMILAGNCLILGGEGQVEARDIASGKTVWTGQVDGKASALAVADGHLLVSTDRGTIHTFRSVGDEAKTVVCLKPTVSPTSEPVAPSIQKKAQAVLAVTDQHQGYALLPEAGEGELARAIVQRSSLQVLGLEDDPARIAKGRDRLLAAKLYGPRVSLRKGTLEDSVFQRHTFNLIVFESIPSSKTVADTVADLVRPCGGTVVLLLPETADAATVEKLKSWGKSRFASWKTVKRDGFLMGVGRTGTLDGAGDWTCCYAEPGNSACSEDRLVCTDVEMQWYGGPGPRRMSDRHQRTVPSLYRDGRLFVSGRDLVYCLDAYNGTILWEKTVPGSQRLSVCQDCSGFCVDANRVYIATGEKVVGLDVKTGEQTRTFLVPNADSESKRDWGYTCRVGRLLLGSTCKPGAAFHQMSRNDYHRVWYRDTVTVTSDSLFAVDPVSGKMVWTHVSDIIPNTTIAAGEGKIFFLETESEKAKNNPTGRVTTKELFDGNRVFLTALDLQSGKTLYRQPLDVSQYEETFYLVYQAGRLVLCGSKGIGPHFHATLYGFDEQDGKRIWSATHNTELTSGGGHGEPSRHPIVVNGNVYAWPYAYDLQTGKKVEGWKFDRFGGGCGEIGSSARCLFWRGSYPCMRDVTSKDGPLRLTTVSRIGCWINAVPAGGLILLPESSSGCTCPYSIQASIAFAPKTKPAEVSKPGSNEKKPNEGK